MPPASRAAPLLLFIDFARTLLPHMSIRPTQSASAIALALGSWAGLAIWMHADFYHQPGGLSAFVVCAGVAALVMYLTLIGYLIYLFEPQPNAGAPRLAPYSYWLVAIAAEMAFGIVTGFGFPKALRTFPGLLFCFTVSLAIVAAGMVLTMTGGPRRRALPGALPSPAPHPSEPRTPFWKVASGVVGVQLAVAAFASPTILLFHAFRNWVDVPRCRALCIESGFTFDWLVSGSKTSHYACHCLAPDRQPRVFYDAPDFLGGHSALLNLAEFFLRAGLVVLALILPFSLLAAPDFVRRKVFGRRS
jgi:hypothetical protein